MYLYFKHINKMYQCGPYSPTHATAGTFAFKSRLLDDTKYEDHAALAEEKAFLKNYTVPFVQLDPMKTILVFSHIHNTFDKKKMLNNQHPEYFKESNKTVDMFIRNAHEANIKNFFMKDIDPLLENYEPGKPHMKPDVIKQIKEIEKEREKMQMEQNHQMQKQMQNVKFMMNTSDGKNVEISYDEIANIVNKQQQDLTNNANIINLQNTRIREMAAELAKLNNKIAALEKENKALLLLSQNHSNTSIMSAPETQPSPSSCIIESSKSEPMYKIDNVD